MSDHTKPTPAGWKKDPSSPIRAQPVISPTTVSTNARFDERKHEIHNRLIDQLNLHTVATIGLEGRRAELRAIVEQLIDTHSDPTPVAERERLAVELLDDILGLGPLEQLLKDPSISDILVNGPFEVFVDRMGRLELTEVKFRDATHLMQVLDRIVSRIGRRIDESSPLVDARLQDGSRVNAIIPPLSLRGPLISIRRFGSHPLSIEDLIRFRMLTPEMAMFLEHAVRARLNIIVSGGTGSGKTSLLNAMSRYIPSHERIITIEDAAELRLQQRHVLPLETRPANVEGKGAISARELVKNALRMRPDRIIIGECRSGETLDMLQAMNTGHDGSMTTLHANTPRDVLARLETMVLMAGFDLPIKAIRQQIAGAIDLIVQTSRLDGGARKVTEITEVLGMEGDTVQTQELFEYTQLGLDTDGRAVGEFRATGIRPLCMKSLRSANADLPEDFFRARVFLRDA